ncbi:MAG: exosortase/archaeosortase family protein, partial [Jatrophihabitans sp.]|uniref:exosortase/archaeosortase family protein n=1 Tax=Jatrophihabitans sp. TaxID=1932789 RepID=UPI00390EA30D
MTSDVNVGSVRRSGARRHLPSLDFQLPVAAHAAQHYRRSKTGPVAGLLMYGAAFWLAIQNDTFRRFEAAAVTPLTDLATGLHKVQTTKTVVFFGLGTPRAFGLDITNECTSALLLIPLLVMMGSFAVFTRISMARQLVALFVGAFLILAVNAFRVALIAWATWKYGYDPGYTYSHVFVGSAFSLVGFVGAMLIALWILVRADRKKSEISPAATPDIDTAVTTVLPRVSDGPIQERPSAAPAHRSAEAHRPRLQVIRRAGA